MKIYEFIPEAVPRAKTRPKTDKADSEKSGRLFEKVPQQAAQSLSLAEASLTVSRENKNALSLPSQDDLGAACLLLSRLGQKIRTASPDELKKVHNLEGLVYYRCHV